MKGTTLQFGGGNVGTLTASAIQAGKVDKFGYRLSIGTNQNADWTNRNALAYLTACCQAFYAQRPVPSLVP